MTINANYLSPGYIDQARYQLKNKLYDGCEDLYARNNLVGAFLAYPAVAILSTAGDLLAYPLNVLETIALGAINLIGVAFKQKGCRTNLRACAVALPFQLAAPLYQCISLIGKMLLFVAVSPTAAFSLFPSYTDCDLHKIVAQRRHGLDAFGDVWRALEQKRAPFHEEIYRDLATLPSEQLPAIMERIRANRSSVKVAALESPWSWRELFTFA